MTPEQQQEADRNTIKVKLIDNAIIINLGVQQLSFPTWDEASKHVGARIEALKRKRAEAAATEAKS